jgi:nucleoside-diphosphate-sugar epimerase
MRVLVAGCGYVGRRLAELRAAAGDQVTAMRRSDADAPRGCKALRADLTLPATLADLPTVDAVVFAPTPDTRDAAGYERTYVDAARNLARALKDPPVRWVHVSSTSVYDEDGGAWVDESTPCASAGFRAGRLLESEEVAAGFGHEAVTLRLGGIYGPGREGLIRRVASGQARVRPRYTNRIHRDDAAGAIGHLLDLDDAERCYVGVDRDPALEADVLDWIAAQLGHATPERDGSGEPRGKRCRSDRLVAAGFEFDFPGFRDGYGALLEELTS